MCTLTVLCRSKIQNNLRMFGNELKCLTMNYDNNLISLKNDNLLIMKKRLIHKQQDCYFSTNGNYFYGAATIASSTTALPGALSKQQAKELAVRLTSNERNVLISALQECQSQKTKAEYEGNNC